MSHHATLHSHAHVCSCPSGDPPGTLTETLPMPGLGREESRSTAELVLPDIVDEHIKFKGVLAIKQTDAIFSI